MDERDCPAHARCPVESHSGHCGAEPQHPPRQRFVIGAVADVFVAVRIAFGMRFERFRRRITGFGAGD